MRTFSSGNTLDDLNAAIPAGSIVGLIGRNGAGKSTFLRLCAGLILRTAGDLRVLGFNPSTVQHRNHSREGIDHRTRKPMHRIS